MKRLIIACVCALIILIGADAAEFHVSVKGSDSNQGTVSAPLRSIQRGAELAQPGDAVTVHAGVYREYVNPPRGGASDTKRIVFQAAQDEKVEIKGSEVVHNWVKVKGDVWKAILPNAFFGSFNPYSDLIRGDWFNPNKREHHTGAVYLNGEWLIEASKLEELFMTEGQNSAGKTRKPKADVLNAPLWFAKVDDANTTIWAQFNGANPNEQQVEVNVRRAVFYPDKPGRNYITVRGFVMRNAATPWAPPTAEQVGLIGTHWSKGWIIENNVISHSICSGIALGKHGDEFDNTSANSAEGYVKTIERAHAHPIAWSRENIGHHVVRNNTISHCEQTGIVGSLGCAFSTVKGNDIHDIHVRRLFGGAEMAGIKFHAAIDVEISGNRIYRTCRGLWLDWMAQGTRVSGNLFHDNQSQDLFVEVDHGPFIVDNNIFLSQTVLLDMSQGGAYVHNLMTGSIVSTEEPGRQTPYHPAHSTAVAGLSNVKGGDNRFYNNIFVGAGSEPAQASKPTNRHRSVSGYGLWVYDERELPLQTGGNVYFNGARPYGKETEPVVRTEINPGVKLVEAKGDMHLEADLDKDILKSKTVLVTTELLGKAKIPGMPYEKADASPLKINVDYLGKKRSESSPVPGPFEKAGRGRLKVKVW